MVMVSLLVVACSQSDHRPHSDADFASLAIDRAAQRYEIVPAESLLVVQVYREGSLARFGHNHIISSTDLHGTIFLAESPDQSSLEVRLPLFTLAVDQPERRAAAGAEFPGTVDADDIAGTRANMLGEQQLDANRWPQIILRSRRLEGSLPDMRLHADLSLKSGVYPLSVPVRVDTADGRVVASGAFTIKQTELGLEPFSVMLGALRVRDQLDIEFRLVAQLAAQ